MSNLKSDIQAICGLVKAEGVACNPKAFKEYVLTDMVESLRTEKGFDVSSIVPDLKLIKLKKKKVKLDKEIDEIEG